MINESNFEERIHPNGRLLPCFVSAPGEEPVCAGGDKGRTLDTEFSSDLSQELNDLFHPFDEYFATVVLNRPQGFDWKFGRELEQL